MSSYIDDLIVENTLDAPEATGIVKGLMSPTDKTKIDTVASGATSNSTDAFLLARANHTGTQLAATISDFSTASDARISLQKGAANGLVPLDGSSKISSIYLPAIAISDTFVVASQAAQVALTAETGDIAVRTDLNKSYILKVNDPTVFANWQELLTPTDAVLSVNGQVGAVSLTTTNISEGTNLYFTTARVLATALTGFVASTNTAIAATDTILQAFQKAQAQITAREGTITAGTTLQYWRGDKTFQTLNTAAVTESTNLYYTDARAQASITGGASTVVTTNLTASRALSSNASGKIAVATTTLAELNLLSGVTSNVQTQLNGLQPLDTTLSQSLTELELLAIRR
jgi:hypothetical protein